MYNQNLFDVASAWCQLALHRIFEKTDLANRARIERYIPYLLVLKRLE